jgi:hypothetical protein
VKYPLRIGTASDLHLGHPHNTSPFIINNLIKAFPDNADTGELDMIVLVGDVFDGLLSLPDKFMTDIDYWIIGLLRLCAKHDIVLRVLEGTPSHDWKQSQRFVTWNEGAQIGCDLRYVKTLEIEYIERFDANVLYIPDEWPGGPAATLEQVKELMAFKNLEKLDFAFMHGQFEYQLPPVVKAPKHDSAAYLALVKHLIFIGHVHMFSQFERIAAQGSFDRLRHNEEEAKGHIRALIEDENTWQLKFIENKGARKFVTIGLINYDLPTCFEEIESRIIDDDIVDGSFIRIECEKGHPLLHSLDHLRRQWPMITWTSIVRGEDPESPAVYPDSELSDDDYHPIQITRDNIVDLVVQHLFAKKAPNDLVDLVGAAVESLR